MHRHRLPNPDMPFCLRQLRMIAIFAIGALAMGLYMDGHHMWSRIITIGFMLWVGYWTPWIHYLRIARKNAKESGKPEGSDG